MKQPSREISSNQKGIHPDLEAIVEKYILSAFRKPITAFNLQAFEIAEKWYQKNPDNFILDSCCGVGESTYHIARQYPDAMVIGVDQSEHRIESNSDWELPKNALLLRADLIDFWRLAADNGWKLRRHFLLYPNPWPKKKHLQRRWHGHPVFPVLKQLGGELELRTNWQLYAEEFSLAMKLLTGQASMTEKWFPQSPITPFERKYQSSGQELYRVRLSL